MKNRTKEFQSLQPISQLHWDPVSMPLCKLMYIARRIGGVRDVCPQGCDLIDITETWYNGFYVWTIQN